MVHVPLVDLRATFEPVRDKVLASFEAVFDGMQLFLGENVRAFEQEFRVYCGAGFGLGCSSGTDAVTLAIMAFDFPPGFEVIVPSHTFFATVESVVHAGGVPVMIDIDPDTYTMDPDRIAEAITEKTVAIMPVHVYGQTADMDAILKIACDNGLKTIEDAAQAHGARYKGRAAGGMGDAAAFSFYFTKNLGAFGEAGFVTTSDEGAYERLQLLRHHGHKSKYEHVIVGYNMRIDELQAAILRAKLPMLDANNARRRITAERYNRGFAELPIVTPHVADGAEHNYHCYVILTDRRDELHHHLGECNVGTGIHYKTPIHQQPAVHTFEHRSHDMPVTESVSQRCLTLPCFPEMTDEQVEHVISSVTSFFAP